MAALPQQLVGPTRDLCVCACASVSVSTDMHLDLSDCRLHSSWMHHHLVQLIRLGVGVQPVTHTLHALAQFSVVAAAACSHTHYKILRRSSFFAAVLLVHLH
ncbi:unnamed protein product [Ceratitis capitata]|uniref:(Mediterranean fruit fly) hypothetical protein n=1 Tax=Ceratitis capitata TaxID=7213 RepID=A0A811V0W8_CERCA|nr:unnamed protein product [Ceratitis capitata]